MSNCYENFEGVLKEIVNGEVLTTIKGNTLEICEENKGATGNRIEISNMTKCMALGLDRDKRPVYFLKDTTKINDHTILYYNNGNLKVILIELKSKKTREVKEQILSGKAYIDFIINLLKIKNIVLNNIEYRAFIFTMRRGKRKQPTKKTKAMKPDWVENEICAKELNNNKTYNLCELICDMDY